MPAGHSSQDNSTLIGGIVGGAVALLLIGALIAFCIVRSRRNSEGQPDADGNAHALQSTPPSNYGRLNLTDRPASTSTHYTDLVATSEHDTYANGQIEIDFADVR